MLRQLVCIGLFVCLAAPALHGQDKNKRNLTWTDPAKAAAEDPDFLVQGEYGVDKTGQAQSLT